MDYGFWDRIRWGFGKWMDLNCDVYCGITVLHRLDMAWCRLDVSGFTRSIFLSVLMRINFVFRFIFNRVL
jgi:hypothetical protein